MSIACLHEVQGISLRETLSEGQCIGTDDIRATSCTSDSRQVRQGDLFVAIIGTQTDGHDHATEVLERGATAVVAERYLPLSGVPQCLVPDTRIALGQICQALAGHPSRQLRTVGVTGTNGKTSTTCLLTSILETAGHPTGLLGTLGYCDGQKTLPATLTTPSAPILADQMARMLANGCSHAVMEVSSHALAQHRTAGVEFDVACFTNISHDHLDYHNTLAKYRAVKARLLDHLREDGCAVLNIDDPACRQLASSIEHPLLTIGMHRPAEINARLLERSISEQTFLLTAGEEIVPVRTRIIGNSHIYNCLSAAAVGLLYGLDLATIVRGIEQVEEIPGRLQRIEMGQPFGTFIDYAHTPDALATTLKTLREVTHKRLICVFGAGGDRDRRKRPLMAGAVEKWADAAIVTDDNPRNETPAAITRDITRGFKNRCGVRVIHDRAAAIMAALESARPGDCVVVAGKGHESCQIVGGERLCFDDREVVRAWLHGADAADTIIPGRALR